MVDAAAQPDALINWMAALAEPTRLRLLHLLEKHELGVAELCDVLQMPQSTVSRHLKVLAEQGWLRSRRQGTTNLYRMILDELEGPARQLWLLAREQSGEWATFAQDQLRLDRRLRQRLGEAESFFAGAAQDWDQLREELYGRAFTRAAMLSLLDPQMVIADLGCGTGDLTAQLAPFVGRVIGVDSSRPMLQAAGQRTRQLKNVELRKGQLQSLPLESRSCDAAVAVLVLSYVAEPSEALAEAARVLKPGGRLVIVDLLRHDRDDFRRQMGQHWMGFEPADVRELLVGAGLSQGVRCEPLPPATEENTRGPALLLAAAGRG